MSDVRPELSGLFRLWVLEQVRDGNVVSERKKEGRRERWGGGRMERIRRKGRGRKGGDKGGSSRGRRGGEGMQKEVESCEDGGQGRSKAETEPCPLSCCLAGPGSQAPENENSPTKGAWTAVPAESLRSWPPGLCFASEGSRQAGGEGRLSI